MRAIYISRQHAQSIVNEMKAAIHRDINIMDGDGVILASTNPARQGQLHQGALRIIREGLPSLVIRHDIPEQGVQQGINLPITINGRLEGVIGITGDPEEVSAFGDIIKRMTEIMLESIQRQEQQELLEKAKSLFVENWLFSDAPDWGELETRGRLLGLDINAPYAVALLGLEEADTGKKSRTEELSEMRSGLILGMIRSRMQGQPANFCAVIRSKIIVLLCGASRNEAFMTVRDICQNIESYHGLRTNAGISDSSMAPVDIRRCYLEAKTAQAVAAQSSDRRVVFYDQVSLEFIVQSIPPSIRQDLNKLIFSACTPQEQREFTQTIWTYFEWDGDIQKCAGHLFIHRNTFQYRMDRIKRKTGYDLKVPKDALLLYLTLNN
ncbi:sugar diacid recognition domain-containing protein [uncultured Dysosmobacter sp.]|uniref:CdaR family transcriptional regulator n=1 Tax=uncultured Dysosmobacter sp. TaxID=2591384 RepID=UPI00262464F9|nr:sugar diacid recognition domain-containing protein [uncultured Dysosmobacter sp.]